MAKNELPARANTRGGPGWWMDLEGVWRAPEEWPEDYPPLDDWVRDPNGQWQAPQIVDTDGEPSHSPIGVAKNSAATNNDSGTSTTSEPRRSRQAEADRRAMFTVVGVAVAALMILAAALILITQAGAEDIPDTEVAGESVVFAAETDEVKMDRRIALAAVAPETARGQLSSLFVRSSAGADDSTTGFDLLEWSAERTDCLDVAEQVLVERSRSPILWADNLECVPDRGRWFDRYLGTTITRTLDADVTLHVPTAIAFVSGGADWSPETRQAYLNDIEHPAMLEITSSGSGHNPRSQDPAAWKPSKQSSWCAYAIDWIAVKDRWDLSITGLERSALSEMLDTCGNVDSDGPDLWTMPIDDIAAPTIERMADAAE